VLSHEGFSEVYLLGHADNETLSDYVRITTDNATSIRLSAEHFILSNGRYVYAKDVKEGDRLAYGEKVLFVHTEQAEGLWNPFTVAGTIVVDGILASCHSDWFLEDVPAWMRPSAAIIPSIYQTLMAPARKIYERNKAWVKRFTKSFEGKAIGEHSVAEVLRKMWKSYWQKEQTLG
jgi:intein/homing endonuclease